MGIMWRAGNQVFVLFCAYLLFFVATSQSSKQLHLLYVEWLSRGGLLTTPVIHAGLPHKAKDMCKLVFLALLGLSLGLVNAFPSSSSSELPDSGKNWVVIVAGSNGWYNYRHQVRAGVKTTWNRCHNVVLSSANCAWLSVFFYSPHWCLIKINLTLRCATSSSQCTLSQSFSRLFKKPQIDWDDVQLLSALSVSQADACHAYQIVHKNGIPDEQIVVMMYDDLAMNEEWVDIFCFCAAETSSFPWCVQKPHC